jgi:hypothetical protein
MVGRSVFIRDGLDQDPTSDPTTYGHAGVGGQVPDEERAPEDPPGVDLDQVIFMEAQSEQSPPDPFPALDLDDAEPAAARRFRQADHF